jgi:hypothetical protein
MVSSISLYCLFFLPRLLMSFLVIQYSSPRTLDSAWHSLPALQSFSPASPPYLVTN